MEKENVQFTTPDGKVHSFEYDEDKYEEVCKALGAYVLESVSLLGSQPKEVSADHDT